MKNPHHKHGARRHFLLTAGAAAASFAAQPLSSIAANTEEQAFENGTRELVRYPQKRPLMLITTRPPHLETPFSIFNESALTPNDAFFVRYHLANLPLSIDAGSYRLKIDGKVNTPLSLTLAELKALAPAVEVVAVNQCSGNSRGFSQPRVFGAQLGNGSMGNASWTGVPLKAVLEKAGIMADARQVTFKGLDEPVLPSTPQFIKALDIEHALNGEPIIAWAMNGEDLPFLNGYPLKLIVPGYFGTYWVKHLSQIEVLDHVYQGFFMSTAYRLPDNPCECVAPGAAPDKTHPIGKLKIRSFITNLTDKTQVAKGAPLKLQGIAFDGGAGIKTVELSLDQGKTWHSAKLAKDLGQYSFRQWRHTVVPSHPGELQLLVRATSNSGETQPTQQSWNPGGYMRNVIESKTVIVA